MVQLKFKSQGSFSRSLLGPLAHQLIFTFTLLMSLLILALIFVSYHRTKSVLIDDFINANKSILRLLNINYGNYVAQIDELSVNLRRDFKFMDILMNGPQGYADEIYIQNQLKIMFYSREDIEKIRLFIPGIHKVYIISKRNNAKIRTTFDKNLTQEDWYRQSTQGEYFRYIEPLFDSQTISDEGNAFFTFHRALVSIPGWKPLGIISLSFNRQVLDKMIQNTFNQKGEAVCIYDKNNQPFYFSDFKLNRQVKLQNLFKGVKLNRPNSHFQIKINKQAYLAVVDSFPKSDWKMIKLIPLQLINAKVGQTRNLSFIIGGIFMLLLIPLIITIANTITSPLRKLTKQMERVGGGNFTAKIETAGSEEMISLAERFNSMVDQINLLINEKYKAELDEKTARLKALEAQINPHFLYNSLQAIATKAVIHGMKDVSQMIEALAYILRYCIKGGDQVKISSEIEHIRKYLMLQMARYEERLQVEIKMEDGLTDILIPKLSIQTLVENSVEHALEHMTRALTIKISTHTVNDQIIIQVTDNGPGISADHLQQVISDLNQITWLDKPTESIGLKNLNSRLRLMYGDNAKLIIESEIGKGTTAKIVLPNSR